nr:aminotransferase class III-fold pyridoxal phosphate-dependent enzyme [Lactiplantibacillus plantarum]
MGHTHPRVVKAIQEQAAKLIHYTPAYFHHQPEQRLAERLANQLPALIMRWFLVTLVRMP